jgi:hypothetical protein
MVLLNGAYGMQLMIKLTSKETGIFVKLKLMIQQFIIKQNIVKEEITMLSSIQMLSTMASIQI